MEVGSHFGPWQLVARLGQGAFGETWQAVDADGRMAAVKALAQPPGNELRALASVCHPAVVGVLGGGSEPSAYLAMELARGLPLDAHEPTHDLDSAVQIIAVLADALAAVHHVGIAHGDVKPANLIVDEGDPPRVTLVDFGIAGSNQGGTLAYAAPERLSGGPPSPSADVYAAGLMFWELLHGTLPWHEIGVERALLRRRDQTPTATAGPTWVRQLLRRLLEIAPQRRPTAAELADMLTAQGAQLPQPTGAMIRRRARVVHVARGVVDELTARWLDDSTGVLAVVGPPKSGRTHTIDRLALELSARGRTWLRLTPDGLPWGAIRGALLDTHLGAPVKMPQRSDAADLAYEAARALRRRTNRSLTLLVDDWETLDAGTTQVIALLAADPDVAMCIAGSKAPEWQAAVAELGPLDEAGVHALVGGVLGSGAGDVPALARLSWDFSGGVPGRVVDLVATAVETSAIARENGRWLVEIDAVRQAVDSMAVDADVDLDLSPESARVGAAIALWGGTVRESQIARLTGMRRDMVRLAVQQLVDQNLVHAHDGKFRCSGIAVAAQLVARADDVEGLHRAMMLRLSSFGATPGQVARHAVGCQDVSWVATYGAAAVIEELESDPLRAAGLAASLWDLAPTVELAAARITALAAAGRIDEALRLGRQLDTTGDTAYPLLLALARVEVAATEEVEAARQTLARARARVSTRRPLELAALEVQLDLQERQLDKAILLAKEAVSGRAPDDVNELDSWLALRGSWAQALLSKGDIDGALAVANEVDEQDGRGRTSRTRFDAMRGRLLWHAGRPAEAGQLMARCARAEGGLPAKDRANLANNAALASYATGDVPEALARWERARMLLDRLGAEEGQIAVQLNLCVGYRRLGRWERSREAGTWAYERAIARGHAVYAAMAAGNLGDLALFLGDTASAESSFLRAAAAAVTADLPVNERAELARRLAEVAALKRVPEALSRAHAAVAECAACDATVEGHRVDAIFALLHANAAAPERARAAAAKATAGLVAAGAVRELAEARLVIAEAWRRLGDSEALIAELTRVTLYAEEVRDVDLLTRADAIGDAAATDLRLVRAPDPSVRIHEIATRVARERDLPTLLGLIAEVSLGLTSGDRCFVVLAEPGSEPRVAASRMAVGISGGLPSWSLVHRALTDAREVIVADLGERPDLRASTSALLLELRSVMVVPMLDDEGVLGAIYVDSSTPSERALQAVAQHLNVLASYGAIAIGNAQRLEAAHKRALDGAEVAHDLRNLMTVILSTVEGLSELLEGPALDMTEELGETTGHMLEMVHRFLAAERSDATRFDLAALARRLGAILSRQARSRGLTLVVDAGAEAWVLGSPEELRRALVNLTHNAFKHGPAGTAVHLVVYTDGDEVVVVVRDHGPGLPPGDVQRLLDRGFTGPGASAGHGFGLFVAARAVMSAGGVLLPANHPDGGAVFTARMPAAHANPWEN
jgi:signal transduction histidine kinase